MDGSSGGSGHGHVQLPWAMKTHPLEMSSLHQSVSLSASVDDRSSTYEDQDNGMDEADDTLAQCSDSPVIRLSFHPSFFICVLELSQKISFQRKCASLVPLLLMSAEAKRRLVAFARSNEGHSESMTLLQQYHILRITAIELQSDSQGPYCVL